MHYASDVSVTWLFRCVHANGARFFFICIYLHIARGIYYGSYTIVHVWLVGCSILLLTIATAFLGYVLPWGQISFWGATVITNLFSAIPYVGSDIVFWLWGVFQLIMQPLFVFCSSFLITLYYWGYISASFIFLTWEGLR